MPKVQQIDNGGRRGRSRRVATTLAEINVVPLVDVMLVLLIIFMVTAPMMQRGFDVNLPVARRSQPISEERVFVTVPLSFRRDHVVQLGDEPINLAILNERIRQKMVGLDKKQVFVRGDGAITYQELLDVMDKLKAGGVENVGLVAKLPGER
ncbi:MAG: biopolymer transporter ExbD [Bacteroidales bacterium]